MGTANQTKQPHTPGPWETREVAHEATPFGKRRVYRLEIIAPQYLYGKRTHSRDICQMVDYCEWTDHPANARLIAAAPEMYEALKAYEALENHRMNCEECEDRLEMAAETCAECFPFADDARCKIRAVIAKVEGK